MVKIFDATKEYEVASKSNSTLKVPPKQWVGINGNRNHGILPIVNCFNAKRDANDCTSYHFASSNEGEGTSTIVIKIAQWIVEAKSNLNILFIDGNFSNPALHQAFDIPQSPGLIEGLQNKTRLSKVIQRVGGSSAYIITSGDTSRSDHLLFEMTKIPDFINDLRKTFGTIIIDSSPLLSSPIALRWAILSDISFMVVQAGQTHWEAAQKAKDLLNMNKCNIGGVILNQARHYIPEWLYKRL
jgi:Mrp family chromosome partitioning ATPase